MKHALYGKIPSFLRDAAQVFTEHGKQVFLVGGALRDLLRGERAADWDIATDARPEEVRRLFPVVIPTGVKHGTVTIRVKNGKKRESIECTTFRGDGDYADGRHPGEVTFLPTIEGDLARRDFTMNALALNLASGELCDYWGGVADIKAKIIRAVGEPRARFAEDGLRPLRALRFSAQLGFDVDYSIIEAIPGCLDVTAKVSAERVRDELDKTLSSPSPARALRLMRDTGLLALLVPELAACAGVEQKGYHQFDVFTHSILACDYAAARRFPHAVVLAALFHDIGKPSCRRRDEDSQVWTFYNHEKKSADLCRALMFRLKYPNAAIDEVCHLVREHMFHYTDDWGDAAVRRFIARAGDDTESALAFIDRLFMLRRADTFATAGHEAPPDALLPFREHIDTVIEKSRAFRLRDLAVSGRDLIAAGIPPGKRLGIILHELLETVLDDPSLNTKDQLITIALNMSTQNMSA